MEMKVNFTLFIVEIPGIFRAQNYGHPMQKDSLFPLLKSGGGFFLLAVGDWLSSN